jgi:flagellar basal body-associated protein FliL
MSKRRWIFLVVMVVIVCGVAAGTRYYLSKCHGMDACAAADAESHERDKPSEPQ